MSKICYFHFIYIPLHYQITKTQKTMENKLIFTAMSAIMQDVEHIAKERSGQGIPYKFRGIDDMYNMLHKHFCKHNVSITSEVLSMQREERMTAKGGTMIYTILTVKFTFFATDGSFMTSVMIGEGSDTGDKASNKAMSTALKYALMQTFLIPTEEEKDTEYHSPEFVAKPILLPLSEDRFPNMLIAIKNGTKEWGTLKEKFAYTEDQLIEVYALLKELKDAKDAKEKALKETQNVS
jgi:hypothetical protein